MIGVVLYVLIDVVLQLLPPHYSPISEAESNLAVGPYGWVMNLNFLGRAVFCVAIVVAVHLTGLPSRRKTAGLVLLLVGGVSSAVLAFFPTDVGIAVSSTLQTQTPVGQVHLIAATTGFIAALLALLLLTSWLHGCDVLRHSRGWATLFVGLGIAGVLGIVASATVLPGYLGLVERVCLLGILGWVFAVGDGIRRLR